MKDDRERLLHIQEAIERIEKYAKRGKAAFARDELIQTWILRHLQIIGEACRVLSPELKTQHSDVPWSDIIGMRNILVHDYFGIDVEAVWSAVERDLPVLKKKIEAILLEMNKKS
jgi:uncharacterized protein with HEPN domain